MVLHEVGQAAAVGRQVASPSRWSWPRRSAARSRRPRAGRPTSPDTRSTGTHSTPAASSSARAAASVKRAAPTTRLSRARAVASGRATCPVTPVTTMVLPVQGVWTHAPFRTRYAARVHLFAAFLGGELAPGRMGEDHEVVFVVAEDMVSARRAAKAKWGGDGRAHVDALTRLDMIDGYAVGLEAGRLGRHDRDRGLQPDAQTAGDSPPSRLIAVPGQVRRAGRQQEAARGRRTRRRGRSDPSGMRRVLGEAVVELLEPVARRPRPGAPTARSR